MKRTFASCAILLIAGLLSSSASAQMKDPVEFGVSQMPYVMILMDTSASMEWTDEGDQEYPKLLTDPLDQATYQYPNTWVHGANLNLDANHRPTVETVGPCYVWSPPANRYERPAWCAAEECPWLDGPGYTQTASTSSGFPSIPSMYNRLQSMRANTDMQLTDTNLPRHVMVKEILTGDMIMVRNGVTNPSRANSGPGCWFVPRSRNAPLENQVYLGQNRFDNLLDHDDPRPHIQEVYDYREDNGLLTRISGRVLIGVTMFDGYQFNGNGWGMNDSLAGDSPLVGSPRAGSLPSPANQSEDDLQNYNLGIYRVIGPKNLDIPSARFPYISAYTQVALADAGYIHTGGDSGMKVSYELQPKKKNKKKKNNSSTQELRENWPYLDLPDRFDEDMEPFTLAKQPISGATPLAAAVHDIHQYFKHGQYQEDLTKDWNASNRVKTGDNNIINPFFDDPYRTCRPKHVIVLTDGFPEPEAPGGNGLGNANLDPAFGYEPNHYPYPLTEDLIKDFVEDASLGVDPLGDYAKHAPRVHIIGVNVSKDGAADQSAVLHKMAMMAKEGKTCAQYYLDAKYLPPGSFNGAGEEGYCDPTNETEICLEAQNLSTDPGSFAGYLYMPADDTHPSGFQCYHPALIFNKNDKITIRAAFEHVINDILGSSGLAARTRPSMTSYLDIPKNIQGQYRMFAGVKMDGSSPFWKGLLNRQTLECDASSSELVTPTNPGSLTPYKNLHNEINLLRGSRTAAAPGPEGPLDATEDSRRVFTMVPHPNTFNYQLNRRANHASHPYLSPFEAILLEDHDEFQRSYISLKPADAQNQTAVGMRVPFEHNTLKQAYVGAGKPFGTTELSSFYDYFKIPNSDSPDDAEDFFRKLVDEVRGRIKEKSDRVLGGIFQSNPVTVGPPDLDIPIDSYREFRARYADRPTMLYVGTLDGQLHAIYTGSPAVKLRQPTTADLAGTAGRDTQTTHTKDDEPFEQREAWAYIPHMLHSKLYSNRGVQPSLLDGSPVVTDIRLCHANKLFNSNHHACSNDDVSATEQWRTVLVQGLGEAGRGYFALDVTRTGDKDHAPDPIPLWEFDADWELGQLQNTNLTQALIGPETPDGCTGTIPGPTGDLPNIPSWRLPHLGRSLGEPAIGTLPFTTVTDESIRRAVAVFSAGSSAGTEMADSFGCIDDRIGRAVYVVDLQNGAILRRFVDYQTETGTKVPFDADVVGTPTLFDDFPGSLVTRGFVGDARGRLFRMDFSSADPQEWKISMFFNPEDYASSSEFPLELDSGSTSFGPASFKPAIAMGQDRNVVVIYGLGERTDTSTAGQTQYIIALKETFNPTTFSVKAEPQWRQKFEAGEKLTGEPTVFNNGVYFTSYYADAANDSCEPGTARIYGLSFLRQSETDYTPKGLWQVDSFSADENILTGPQDSTLPPMTPWFGPKDPTLIRGVTVTLGPACSETSEEDEDEKSFSENTTRKPQLIAQSGTASPGDQGGSSQDPAGGSAIADAIGRIEIDLERPSSQSIPLSWTVITN